MTTLRIVVAAFLLVGIGALAAPPWYVDDEQFGKDFSAKLTALAKKNECIRPNELKKRLKAKTCRVTLTQPGTQALSPEDVYERALESVFVVGSVERSEKDRSKWEDGRQATAWALTADGVLVTNWHVFEKTGRERFGVANHKGEVFPVIDVLACDPEADVAVIKVKGTGFKPLALAGDERVGAWVAVLSHPGGQLFTFTQGHITRYAREPNEKKPIEWMSISADFAVGSSGGPVLNRFGAVVGMATSTITTESDEEEQPEKPKTRRRQEPPPVPKPAPPVDKSKEAEKLKPQVQMVTKLAVPVRVIRALVQNAD